MNPRVLMLAARALALSWAGFWMFFIVAESLAWNTPASLMLPWLGVGLVFIVLAMVPWRWEVVGGELLATAGLVAGTVYWIWPPPRLPLFVRLLTTLLFAGPPIVAAIFFLIHHRAQRGAAAGH